ncbi:uncharacterized protein PFL1_06054 [Pseudozyma flocculosa PF-1]|nr:uncharacterized protein PFL1_06054 [Pseudozyma flocculosa PF-1]EPQ26406.1 hypothetical protein PFL1_06054 [Pseudozyma flocculosa PF-1]
MAANRPAAYSAPPPAAAQPHAAPQQHAAAPAAQSAGPGLFGQMASTAAGVAVGSTVGHGLSNMLFGGRSEPAAEATQAPQPAFDQSQAYSQQQNAGVNCEVQSRDFIKCLESTNDMNSCSYYLEQLKACQAAARPY